MKSIKCIECGTILIMQCNLHCCKIYYYFNHTISQSDLIARYSEYPFEIEVCVDRNKTKIINHRDLIIKTYNKIINREKLKFILTFQ